MSGYLDVYLCREVDRDQDLKLANYHITTHAASWFNMSG